MMCLCCHMPENTIDDCFGESERTLEIASIFFIINTKDSLKYAQSRDE